MPWWPPRRPEWPSVVVVVIVLVFAGVLVLAGYDIKTAVAGAGGAGLVGGEVAHRVLGKPFPRAGTT
jgi:hypothetical protein